MQRQRSARRPSKSYVLRILVLLVACTTGLPASAAEADVGRATQIIKTSELQAGMTGYGLTTFEGARVERFDVKVLGVMRGWSPQGDIVLIEMSGPLVEKTGTVAGMSGSPVYVDDRLLGAVSYGFYFAQIPLAGVTPIEEMLVARELDQAPRRGDRGERKASIRRHLRAESAALADVLRSRRLPDRALVDRVVSRMVVPLSMRGSPGSGGLDGLPPAVRARFPEAAPSSMAPLPTPLAFGGVSPAAFGMLNPMLQAVGFVPVQAGVTALGAGGGEEIPIAPGVPVGVVLVSGDLDISGMGTLTMVDGNRVLAFGHPMFGTGESDLPLAVGRVQAVVPSMLHSFRLTTADRVVGRLTQDRDSAVVGRLGERAPVFPCTVTVKGQREITFRYEVAGYWETAPMLAFWTTLLSASRWEIGENMYTVRVRSSISLQDRPEPIVLENRYAEYMPQTPFFELVWMPLAALTLNPFEELQLASLDVDVEVEAGLRAAVIESVRVGHRTVEPGGKIEIFVKLKEFQGDEHVKKIELDVPKDAQAGAVAQILVCDGITELMIRMSQDPGLFGPRDLAGLIEAIQLIPSNSHVFAHATFLRRGVRYEGAPMPTLPSSVFHMLNAGTESGATTPLVKEVAASVPTPWVVEGGAELTVEVREGVGNRY